MLTTDAHNKILDLIYTQVCEHSYILAREHSPTLHVLIDKAIYETLYEKLIPKLYTPVIFTIQQEMENQ